MGPKEGQGNVLIKWYDHVMTSKISPLFLILAREIMFGKEYSLPIGNEYSILTVKQCEHWGILAWSTTMYPSVQRDSV